jgi:integrase
MLKTKSGLPKHCSWNQDQHGTRRVRFRKSGFSTYLTGTPWSEDFMRQYAAALDGVKVQAANIGAELRTRPGSINELCVAYYRSPAYLDLKASTKEGRRGIIESFRKAHGDKPVGRLERKHVEQIIAEKRDTPNAANNLLKVIRLLLSHAVDIGMLTSSPALGIKRFKIRGDGYPPWDEEQIAQFERHHAVGTKARLAFALLLYTAQRVSDVIKMGRQHLVGDTAIKVTQEKTGTSLTIPLHPGLKAIIAAAERTGLLFLTTRRGTPFSRQVFTKWFRQQCDLAGVRDRSAHGLRKSAATRLADAHCTPHEIAAITGHASLREVERYTKARDQEKLARQQIRRMEGERDLSSLSARLDKTAEKS